jgi:hypothetical protein
MTLRAIQAADENSSGEPEWMAAFLLSLQALLGGRSAGRR